MTKNDLGVADINENSEISLFVVAENHQRYNYADLLHMPGGKMEMYWQKGSSGSGNFVYLHNRDNPGNEQPSGFSLANAG